MELQTNSELEYNKKKPDVFLIYDTADEDTADLILQTLNGSEINCCTLYDTPGKSMFSVFTKFALICRKAIFLLSTASIENKSLLYGLSMVMIKISKDNIITVLVTHDRLIKDELQLLQHTAVVRTNEVSWLVELVKELLNVMPSYTKILKKGDITDSLTSLGLCIQHMESNILGILIMVDKLCLQIDLREYLIYQDQHRKYKTAKVLEEFRHMCNINSSIVLVLKDGVQKALRSAEEDIAVFASAVIDTSMASVKCDWTVACTVTGKYGKNEQMFLSGIYPRLYVTVLKKFVETCKEPLMPHYAKVVDRINSYPQKWRDDNFEAIAHMSAAGFFYAGFGEYARCYYCGCLLINIRAYKNPLSVHAAWFSSCCNVRNNLTDDEINQATKDFMCVGENSRMVKAVKEQYKSVDSRMQTFGSYEYINGRSNVNICKLATAGFFYTGIENLVQCFCCSVRIYVKPNEQNAWGVHASLSPTCSYVIQEKGQNYIDELQTAKEQTLDSEYTIFSFFRKTYDNTKRRNWPLNMFRPWAW